MKIKVNLKLKIFNAVHGYAIGNLLI